MAYTFAHGTGTAADPYLVATAADLNGVRDYLSAHFKQVADIDLSGYVNWEPIGDSTEQFGGNYDGNGHEVNNLTINRADKMYIGLFGSTWGATIKNVIIATGSVTGNSNTGGLIGYSAATTVVNCGCSADITGAGVVGGLIGRIDNYTSLCSGCYSTGVVSSNTGQSAGGLVGVIYEGTILNSYATGDVSNPAKVSGGLVGNSGSSAKITNCYSIGKPTGTDFVGGLIGYQFDSKTVTSSYYDSQTSGQSDRGKGTPKTTAEMKTQATFAGWDFDTVWAMPSSVNDGYPCLQWQLPPPIEVWTAEDLNNVRNNLSGRYIQMADIDLSGYANWEPIGSPYIESSGIYYDGNGHEINGLTINRTGGWSHSGLFGHLKNATVKNLGVININISGQDYIGGLAGGISHGSKISNCYVTGEIAGRHHVGGLVGESYINCAISDCYSMCKVSGSSIRIGGLIGRNYSDSSTRLSTVTRCYSINLVTGYNVVGGLIGENNLRVSEVTSSYYDSELSGCSDTDKGEPKTTAEMKTQSTFVDWDFETVWGIDPAKNDGYPYLLWQQFDPPPEPFQPWTPPKLEPSWWEGFKLPFNVLELDEDAPIAIQRNFKEIEHYINFLGRTSGEIKDNLELLAAALAPMSEEEMPDPEPEVPPTDSYFAGYILGKEGQMGSIDAAIKTDSLGGINEVWIARVIDKQGIVEIYDSDAPEHIFRTVARELNLPLVNLGADVVDVAIEFDGTYDQYNIFVSETEPHIFWVERTGSEDIIYTIKWDGVDPAPEPIELARAQLGYLGSGITVGLDPNITV